MCTDMAVGGVGIWFDYGIMTGQLFCIKHAMKYSAYFTMLQTVQSLNSETAGVLRE